MVALPLLLTAFRGRMSSPLDGGAYRFTSCVLALLGPLSPPLGPILQQLLLPTKKCQKKKNKLKIKN